MHALQRRVGLLDDNGLPGLRAALALALAAWLPLALLALGDARNWSFRYGTSLFADAGAYTRYLLAIMVFIATDRTTEIRLNRLLDCLPRSGIVPPDSLPQFARLLERADRRTSSALAEGSMLVLAIALAVLSVQPMIIIGSEEWAAAVDTNGLSPAGWWSVLVSAPLFFFLMLRWGWRFLVWARLFRSIAGLPLELVATHPDRCGGLGFLTLFPMIFIPLAVGLSLVLAASALQEVTFSGASSEMLRTATLTWVGVVLVLFAGPLTAFTPQLLRLRERAIVELGALAPDPQTVNTMCDAGPIVATVHRIKLVPVELWAILPLVVVAFAPMLAVATIQVPIWELLSRPFGALV